MFPKEEKKAVSTNIGFGFAHQRKLLYERILCSIKESSGKDVKTVMAITMIDVGCSEKFLKEAIGNLILAGRVKIKDGYIHAIAT
jgi:hypothetical protein